MNTFYVLFFVLRQQFFRQFSFLVQQSLDTLLVSFQGVSLLFHLLQKNIRKIEINTKPSETSWGRWPAEKTNAIYQNRSIVVGDSADFGLSKQHAHLDGRLEQNVRDRTSTESPKISPNITVKRVTVGVRPSYYTIKLVTGLQVLTNSAVLSDQWYMVVGELRNKGFERGSK